MCECLSEYGSSAPLFLITSSGFSLATAGSSSACAVPKAETQHPFLPSKIATRTRLACPEKEQDKGPKCGAVSATASSLAHPLADEGCLLVNT